MAENATANTRRSTRARKFGTPLVSGVAETNTPTSQKGKKKGKKTPTPKEDAPYVGWGMDRGVPVRLDALKGVVC